jgi:5-methylcytosine-specific restriction endonuclease McrA
MKFSYKETRIAVWEKYDKHCAYCGKEIEYKQMQIDHIEPLFRNYKDKELEYMKRSRGEHNTDNFNPSCARCNRWKSTYTLEQFRKEISLQIDRLNRDSNNYRMAIDFGLIQETKVPVKFYFENINYLKE